MITMGCCVSKPHVGVDGGGPKTTSGDVKEVGDKSTVVTNVIDDQLTSIKPPPNPEIETDKIRPAELRSATRPISLSSQHVQLLVSQGRVIVRAIYDYTSVVQISPGEIPDLNFKTGDFMEVLKEDGDWWLAESLKTHIQGYIPSTYVARENTVYAFDWFHGNISRSDTEKQLIAPGNIRGTYLVRESESTPGAFSLSMLDEDARHDKSVRHYKIRNTDTGGFYIATKIKFNSLVDLVHHYSLHADGLCYTLARPCAKAKPQTWDMSRHTRDRWEIPRSELEFITLLGKGAFGEVWKGKWRGGLEVAIKSMRAGTTSVRAFLDEAAIMKKLHHPRLVALYAVCSLEEPLYIVTELMSHGSLLDYLRKGLGQQLLLPDIIDISAQVADGMRYIESERHIHRDLAARNILVGDNRNVKIGDFGLAKAIVREQQEYIANKGGKFPVKWTALEAALYGTFSIKSDVWAYGILLIELVTHGKTPYEGKTNTEVLELLQKNYRHPQPADCPVELYDIMLSCWKRDPATRPTFEHLYHTMHDFPVAVESGYREVN